MRTSSMRRALAISLILLALPLAADEFRVDRVLESLTGSTAACVGAAAPSG